MFFFLLFSLLVFFSTFLIVSQEPSSYPIFLLEVVVVVIVINHPVIMAEKMDLLIVRDNFEKAKSAKGDVDFDPFIKGYEEIARCVHNIIIISCSQGSMQYIFERGCFIIGPVHQRLRGGGGGVANCA